MSDKSTDGRFFSGMMVIVAYGCYASAIATVGIAIYQASLGDYTAPINSAPVLLVFLFAGTYCFALRDIPQRSRKSIRLAEAQLEELKKITEKLDSLNYNRPKPSPWQKDQR